MRKFFLGLFLALSLATLAFAEVEIPKDKRVANFESGCCVWCSVENLGNIHGITSLNGIAKYRNDNYGKKKVWVEAAYAYDIFGNLIQIQGPHWREINEAPGTPSRVREEFARLKVKYKMQLHGDTDHAILKEAMDKKLGCAIGVKDYPGEGNYHMITLTEFTDEKVVFVDNNGTLPRVEKSREWFDAHWTGYTIIVYPEVKKPERPKIKKPERPKTKKQ